MNGRLGEVWFVEPGPPSPGSKIEKMRPWVIVQAPEMDQLPTTIAIPLTNRGYGAPFRVATTFGGSTYALCDRIRAIDRRRLNTFAGKMNGSELAEVLRTLRAMFAP